jgi:SpoVK/Ycf46/Vps4 family AAA+-type ATPase
MAVSPDVNFEELARSTDEFNGAQLKAVCVEAGMIALRDGAKKLGHEHFLSGIVEGKIKLSFYYRCRANQMPLACSSEQEEEYFALFCVVHRAIHVLFYTLRSVT